MEKVTHELRVLGKFSALYVVRDRSNTGIGNRSTNF